MSFDPMSELITSIKNAQAIGKIEVVFTYSKLKMEILNILKKMEYITDFKMVEVDNKKDLKVSLKYRSKKPAITLLRQISKPGRRIYAPYRNIPRPSYGFGVIILSTPKGILTDKDAKKNGIGGEILCEVS